LVVERGAGRRCTAGLRYAAAPLNSFVRFLQSGNRFLADERREAGTVRRRTVEDTCTVKAPVKGKLASL
jgi:hypothetical protein